MGKPEAIKAKYVIWLMKPIKGLPKIPDRTTASVCSVIGIGVKGRYIVIWARTAVNDV